MANQGPLGRSRYFHHASAFGISGQIDRPIQQTIPTQAAISLGPSGGHGTHRVDNYKLPGIVSCGAAYVETGGSIDEANGSYATYASSVIEDLNIFNVITADRVVSRLTVYHPTDESTRHEASFSITGSHFDNLKILGKKIDVNLEDSTFHDSTYSGFCNGNGANPHPNTKWLVGSNIDDNQLQQLQPRLGHNYDIVNGVAQRYHQWVAGQTQPRNGDCFWCSAANQLNLASIPGLPTDLINFGGLISIPRFGTVCLAELFIHKHHRHLTMLRVTMYSPGGGNIDGGGTGGGGTTLPPG